MGTGDTSSIEDDGGISGTDNNSDSKNIYVKASFGTYNIADADADTSAGVGDTSDTRDVSDTGNVDNNTNNKNAYAKADFNIYNVADANASTGVGDAIITNEKVDSNIKIQV